MGDPNTPNQFLPMSGSISPDTPSFSPAVADSFALTRGDSTEPGGVVTSVGAAAPITSTGGVAPVIGITPATQLAAGSLSAADKTKLDNVTGPLTAATVTSVNSPYAVLNTDRIVLFDESNGNVARANLPAPSHVGEAHTFVWFKWTGASPPPVIGGGGNQLTPYSQATQTSGALVATTNILSQGDRITYEWDGAEWMQTA
jgi:hypothetical protein